jgi:hypothetical protein
MKRFLAPCFGEDELDLVGNEGTNELEVMTDDWTLHVDLHPNRFAWLAVDIEPDSAEEARTIREEVIGPEVVRALAQVDHALDGALSSALVASDDLLSTDVAAAILEARSELRERTDISTVEPDGGKP